MKEAIERIDTRRALHRRGPARERAPSRCGPTRAASRRSCGSRKGNITEPGEPERDPQPARAVDALPGACSSGFQRADPGAAARRTLLRRARAGFLAVKEAADAILAMNQDAMVRKSERAQRLARALEHLLIAVALWRCLLGLRRLRRTLTSRLLRPLRCSARRRAASARATWRRARVVARPRRDRAVSRRVQHDGRAPRSSTARARSASCSQAQQASQAAIDSLPDPVRRPERRGASDATSTARPRALLGIVVEGRGSGAARPRWSPPVRAVDDAAAPARARRQGRLRAPGASRRRCASRRRTATGMLLPRASPRLRRGRGSRRRDRRPAGRDPPAPLRRAQERPGRHGRARVPHAAHVAAHGDPPVPRGGGRPAHRQAGRPALAAREDCERLQAIVDDLLDLSRIQAGRIELRRGPVAVEPLVEAALDAQRARATQARVRLRLEALPGAAGFWPTPSGSSSCSRTSSRTPSATARPARRSCFARAPRVTGPLRGRRHGPRHPGRVPAGGLREVLPGPGESGRRRPGPVHRAGDRPRARRPDRRRERAGQREHLLVRTPGPGGIGRRLRPGILSTAMGGCGCGRAGRRRPAPNGSSQRLARASGDR